MAAREPLFGGGGGGGSSPSTSGVTTGAIVRAITASSMRNLQQNQEMRDSEWAVALDEIDQQARIPFAADVNEEMSWTNELSVGFPATFVDAPEQRTTQFGEPHFTFGVEMRKGFALVTVLLRRYGRSDDYITSATVVIGVCVPGASKKLKVDGVVHLNFQGYGAVQDQESDVTDESEMFTHG